MMYKLLIFGGTTEGRLLAEFCAEHGISADISVTTDYGETLLPQSSCINVLNGRLDKEDIKALITKEKYIAVIDATHPYAVNATENIRSACDDLGTGYYRLIREKSGDISGRTFSNLMELVKYLDDTDKRVLSTLGSKELPALTAVKDYKSRIWARVLPADRIIEYCCSLGFDEDKVITGKGPFSVEENIRHIKMSGAEILVTKESGAAGGFPEKAAAADKCGIELVTLLRPTEKGYTLKQIQKIILEIK
ncbi:MAG: precorrin-6A reductase [Oscillospiraceae bacterium]